eukprot:2395467-Lingulodinium_polyedra.AAC.1
MSSPLVVRRRPSSFAFVAVHVPCLAVWRAPLLARPRSPRVARCLLYVCARRPAVARVSSLALPRCA